MPKWMTAFGCGIIRFAKILWRIFGVIVGIPMALAFLAPAVILALLGITYTLGAPNLPPDRALQIALVGYGILVSLSGLCFTAASAVDESTRFYTLTIRVGKSLFLATVGLVLAGVMQYAWNNFFTDLSMMQANPESGPAPIVEFFRSPVGQVMGEIYRTGVGLLFSLSGMIVTFAFVELYIYLIRDIFALWRPENTE